MAHSLPDFQERITHDKPKEDITHSVSRPCANLCPVDDVLTSRDEASMGKPGEDHSLCVWSQTMCQRLTSQPVGHRVDRFRANLHAPEDLTNTRIIQGLGGEGLSDNSVKSGSSVNKEKASGRGRVRRQAQKSAKVVGELGGVTPRQAALKAPWPLFVKLLDQHRTVQTSEEFTNIFKQINSSVVLYGGFGTLAFEQC